MKRFTFSLQTVHDVREIARDEAERRLASAAAEVASATEAIAATQRERVREAEALAVQYSRGDLDPRESAFRFGYLESLAQREADARIRLHSLERTRDRVRDATVNASREAEVTSKLRDRHLARHRAEIARAEQEMLDDLIVIAAGARRSEQGAR